MSRSPRRRWCSMDRYGSRSKGETFQHRQKETPMSTEVTRRDLVDVGGHRIAYTRVGHGPAVVLIHGIPTNAYLWRNVVPLLVAAGFEAITFDLLGYGASDKPADADLGIKSQSEILVEAL